MRPEKKDKNLTQLPSGSWRLQKMIKGQYVRVTFDHKPTEAEIQLALADNLQVNVEDIPLYKDTLKICCESYIKSKRNVLSPATIREYERITKNAIPADLLKTPLSKITQIRIQNAVNDYASTHSPKSTANYSSFICSVLKMYGKDYRVTLPQKEDKEPYIPTADEVKAILSAVSGTKYEIPYMLACCGLRRSEICALTADDIEIISDHIAVAHVNKALVKDEHNKWVIKTPKTRQSNREINIPVTLAQQIINQGQAYKGYPDYLSDHLYEIEDSLGIERFSLHRLRHYFASALSESGVSEADILALGGWSTPSTMKNIYRHSMLKNKQEERQNVINNLMNNIT